MSYPQDIDELTEETLLGELELRHERREKGVCDYCGRDLKSEPACRFPARHAMPAGSEPWYPHVKAAVVALRKARLEPTDAND